jgi:hypothetical protein
MWYWMRQTRSEYRTSHHIHDSLEGHLRYALDCSSYSPIGEQNLETSTLWNGQEINQKNVSVNVAQLI